MYRLGLGLGSVLAIAIMWGAQGAFADDTDGSNNAKIQDVDGSLNKVKGDGESADDVLTNNKLRAESGSMSRFSIASSLTYNGASISRPFADYRPNIQNVNGDSPISDIEGGVQLKYNLTKKDSLLFGETVRWVTPLSSPTQKPADYAGQKVDSYNPGLTYQRIYKVGELQSYVQAGPNIITQSDYTRIGYLGNANIYNVNAYDIGTSRFTVGLETEVQYAWFRNPQAYPDADLNLTKNQVEQQSTDLWLLAYPYLEYKINDSVNIRTVCMWFSIEHTLARPEMTTWVRDTAMQSVGVGISVTRDIFLYPNIQFVPDELRAKQTNVALSTNINLF